MSLQKQIRRNIERQNQQLFDSYGSQTPVGWRDCSGRDKSLFADMARNGIKPADLEREYKRGRDEAYRDTAPAVTKVCYAAFAIVLAECGLTPDEIFYVVMNADQKVFTAIDHEEIIAEMEKKARIRFFAQEGIERVVKIDGEEK